MKNIINVYNQEEFDSLPKSFEIFTKIYIHSHIIIERKINNSCIILYGTSAVVKRAAEVVSFGSSDVVMRDDSRIEAHGTEVIARDNSHVIAYNNSIVQSYNNSHIIALGNSCIIPLETSVVEAYENSIIKVHENSMNVHLLLNQCSVAICYNIGELKNVTINGGTIVYKKTIINNKETFLKIYKNNIQPDGRILLYASVNQKDHPEFFHKNIKDIECRDDVSFSPTLESLISNNKEKTLECLVNVNDFVVCHDIDKVRCKKVEVIQEI